MNETTISKKLFGFMVITIPATGPNNLINWMLPTSVIVQKLRNYVQVLQHLVYSNVRFSYQVSPR